MGRLLFHLVFGPWPVWAVFSLILICGCVAHIFEASERNIRFTGLGLQILGFLTTMGNLIGIGNAFDAPSIIARVRRYFLEFPKRNKVISVSGAMSVVTTGDAVMSIGRNPNASVADRLKRLEMDADRIDKEILAIRRAAKAEREQLASQIVTGDNALRAEIAKVMKLVNDAMTDSLSLQWVGIFYFVVGVGLSTASPELACLLTVQGACR